MKIVSMEIHGSRGKVTVESELDSLPNQIEELASAAAKNFALASSVEGGIKGSPGISRTVDSPFPVNSEGETIGNLEEDGKPLPPDHPRCQAKAYRVTFEITAMP
jgi:hypothetical protein